MGICIFCMHIAILYYDLGVLKPYNNAMTGLTYYIHASLLLTALYHSTWDWSHVQ